MAAAGSWAVNEMDPERVFLMESAEAVAYAEGNTVDRVMASHPQAPGVEDPIALYTTMIRQPLRSPELPSMPATAGRGMSDEAKSRERPTAQEKSDRVIVPTRLGNFGGGRDATPTTRSKRASPGHSLRDTVPEQR
jgi:hypothetical protein